VIKETTASIFFRAGRGAFWLAAWAGILPGCGVALPGCWRLIARLTRSGTWPP